MRDFFKILGLVTAVSLIRSLLGLDHFQAGIDDSNIYFVYVRNLADGHGFVYNAGGPRVEGFTSLLWTLFLALLYSIRFTPFETSLMLCCLLITTGIVWAYFRYIKSLAGEPHAWLIALFIVLTPGFIDWNVFTLMDLPLWILAVSTSVIFMLNGSRPRLFMLLVVLLPFIRPEGLLVSVMLVVLRMYISYSSGNSLRQVVRLHGPTLLAACVAISGLTIFRLSYFGYPFPNTFYAKVSVSLIDNIKTGVFYFYDTLRHTSLVPAILLLICVVYVVKRRIIFQLKQQAPVISLLIIIGFFLCYPFLTGGDHFKYSRFFQPLFPLIALLFMYLFHRRLHLHKLITVSAAALVLLLLNLNSTDDTSFRQKWSTAAISYFREMRVDLFSHSQLQSEFDIAVYGRQLAAHMNRVLEGNKQYPSYGVVAAGGTGYIYNGHLVDLMGLNNPEMAHADRIKAQGVKNHGSFDKAIFYKQDPDIFLTWPDPLTAQVEQTDETALHFYTQLNDSAYFINRVCKHIFNDADFNERYKFCRIEAPAGHFYGYIKPGEFSRRFPAVKIQPITQSVTQ